MSMRCQHEAKGGRGRAWKAREGTSAVGGDRDTVHENYIIDTEFNLQITHKYPKEVENLQK